MSLQFDLDRVYLTLEDVTIDDDMTGGSHGDGDGVIESGETIELTIALYNAGHWDAADVTGELEIGPEAIGIQVSSASFGNIMSGSSAVNSEPFLFYVADHVPDGMVLEALLDVSEDPGIVGFDRDVRAPAYVLAVFDIDDSVGGNGDGIANPGETVAITLTLQNVGGTDSPVLEVLLDTSLPYFTPDGLPQNLGILEVGAGLTTEPFTLAIAPECPPLHSCQLRLLLSGPDHYYVPLQFLFTVGQVFGDDMEEATSPWWHYAEPGGWQDQWHLETYRNHTPTGTRSWKCGGAGSGAYTNLLHAILESPPFELPPGSELRFWHWMDAETSAAYPGYSYDGGLLMMSDDGGVTWEQLVPDDGYPYLIRDGSILGPFAADTPVWSGHTEWTEVTIDLTGHEGLAMLRYIFGSDGADTAEGWYLDDLMVCPLAASGLDDAGSAAVIRPYLYPVRPNPVAIGDGAGAPVLHFTMPNAGSGKLALFDAGGRLIRVLVDGWFTAGRQRVVWDGRDAGGRSVGTGSYYYRLSVGDQILTRKLAVIR